MSYCALVGFKDGISSDQVEFRNSWGGAARIWTTLQDKYVPKRNEYDSWLSDNVTRVCALRDDPRLSHAERIVLYATFDNCIVEREGFGRLAAALRDFVRQNPVKGLVVDHLPAWADALEGPLAEYEAVGLHHTSVSENPWYVWDEETEESKPYDLVTGTKHWELFEAVEEPAAPRAQGQEAGQ